MSLNKLFLREVSIKADGTPPPILKDVFPMLLRGNITVIIGENGSGKSTLLESIAIKLGCNPEGGGRNFRFKTEDTNSALHSVLRVVKGYRKEKDIFFYRAESFYNLTSEIRALDAESSFDPKINTYYGGRDLHDMSHGESMEALYQNRFGAEGLYILDEPEASLSPQRQLNFIARISHLAEHGAQFIIATHSPFIIFTPGCDLFSLENGQLLPVRAVDSQLYNLYRAVISSSGGFIKTCCEPD